MPLTACFVRHGESEANVKRVFANRVDSAADLTQTGFAEAKALADALKSFRVTHVFTSPLARARRTATLIAGALGVSCTSDDALREYDVGDFEGESYDEEGVWRWRRYEDVERSWREGRRHVSLPGGESLTDLEARFLPLMDILTARHTSDDVLALVGHGGLYRAMLPRLFANVSPEYAWAHQLGHGDVVAAEYEHALWHCVQWASESFPRG